MVKVGIIGATGYAGAELVRILLNHKEAQIEWFGSRSYIDENYADIYRNFFELVDADCLGDNMDELASRVDVIFTATPQGFLAGVLNEDILNKVKIIDLSADFRIKDVATYEKWYKIEHKSPQFIKEAVYGLCEINRDKVTTQTRLIANPGCYTTCSILTAYPLAKEGIIDMRTLIVDAKSGTSGAGRSAKVANLYCEVNESIKAYGVATHRHTPEIEEQLSYASGQEAVINFTPHLVPMNRGILVTAYANLVKDVTENMDKFELGIALSKIYDFMWDEFCDWYIEMVKPRLYNSDNKESKTAALWTLKSVLINALKLLHPYMPFITEEIFCTLQSEEESIMISKWPEYQTAWNFEREEKGIELIKEAVRGIRNVRTKMNVAPGKKASVYVVTENQELKQALEDGRLVFASLACASEVILQQDKTGITDDMVSVVILNATIYMPFAELVDIRQEIERLEKEEKRLSGELARVNGMLNNERFMSKAPEAKVAEEREKLVKYSQMMEQVKERLAQLRK